MANFEEMSVESTLNYFNVNNKNGLDSIIAEKKLQEYGQNTLEEKKQSILLKLLQFFWGPIPIMIEIAAILSAILERWPDLIIILFMLFVNAGLGFFQEYKAGNAIDALRNKLALGAFVLRDGLWQSIDAKNLVPGDIISVKLGNIIPADVKLISGEYLSVDQSSLTGESMPVSKKIGDISFSGTIAKLGQMIGVVVETGMKTFFGKTAKLVSEAKVPSHFQKAILTIGNFLIVITLIICAIILISSIYRIEVIGTYNETIGSVIIFILVLVIAGIPIALPAVLSATMAIGANKLASMKAIVAKLTSIDSLAGMSVLCSDKTGTLTKNQLSVGDIKLFDAKEDREILDVAYLSCSKEDKDAIDTAIANRIDNKTALDIYVQEKFTPFDPTIKRTEAIINPINGEKFIAIKGAPQVVLRLCNPSDELIKEVNKTIEDFAKKGYRTLGIAKGFTSNTLKFLGIISLSDPPRDDTKETLHHIKNMGVTVKMVTGDHGAIAKELSNTLDLGTNIIAISKVDKEIANDPIKLGNLINDADGFSEVFPEDKFKIIKSLQHHKLIVGMTGDGVNDAPALKQADVGIAVDGAVDAAKAAADIVLTEPGLLVISHAIDEARRVFGRMKSYAMYRISETCRLLFFLFLSMLIFNDHPLTAIMIIVIALLNDIPIMMIAYDHMRPCENPVKWNFSEIFTVAVSLAIVGVISTFGLYWIGDQYWFADIGDDIHKFHLLRTLAFMAILCGGNLTIYLTRNEKAIWSKPLPECKFFLSTLLSLIIGTIVSVYGLGTKDFVGIGWKYVGYSWIYIILWFFICMIIKEALYIAFGYRKKNN